MPNSPEVRQLKLRKLLADVQHREHRLGELRPHYVSMDAVRERWQFHIERAAAVLGEMADSFASEIVGVDAVETRKAGERFVDRFVARMRSGT